MAGRCRSVHAQDGKERGQSAAKQPCQQHCGATISPGAAGTTTHPAKTVCGPSAARPSSPGVKGGSALPSKAAPPLLASDRCPPLLVLRCTGVPAASAAALAAAAAPAEAARTGRRLLPAPLPPTPADASRAAATAACAAACTAGELSEYPPVRRRCRWGRESGNCEWRGSMRGAALGADKAAPGAAQMFAADQDSIMQRKAAPPLTCAGLPLPSWPAPFGSLSLWMGSIISTSIRTGWHMGDWGSVECTCAAEGTP
jgi:hypothetical protein